MIVIIKTSKDIICLFQFDEKRIYLRRGCLTNITTTQLNVKQNGTTNSNKQNSIDTQILLYLTPAENLIINRLYIFLKNTDSQNCIQMNAFT